MQNISNASINFTNIFISRCERHQVALNIVIKLLNVLFEIIKIKHSFEPGNYNSID